MKNIIVYPTDFSKCAANALSFAVAMAKAKNCKLKAIHNADFQEVLAVEENPKNALEKIKSLEKEVVSLLKKVKVKAEKQGVVCEYEVVRRSISGLDNYLNKLNPQMVVMGTTGSSGFENKLMGSLTYKIIKNIQTPVLAVPHKASFKGFQNIVFATDFANKDIDSIGFLIEVAEYFKAHVEVVHVFEGSVVNDPEEKLFDNYKRSITQSVSYKRLDFKLLQWENVEDRLSIFLNESNADLLALVSKPRKLIDRLFRNSLTKKMAYHTRVPLIAF